MRAPKGLAFSEIQSRQLTLQWEPLGYNLTRCHTYTVSLCYRYLVGSGHNQTFRECAKMERNANRYTIKNLLPYKNIHVKLILSNPEGRKEGKEVTFQTDEDGKGTRRVWGASPRCSLCSSLGAQWECLLWGGEGDAVVAEGGEMLRVSQGSWVVMGQHWCSGRAMSFIAPGALSLWCFSPTRPHVAGPPSPLVVELKPRRNNN